MPKKRIPIPDEIVDLLLFSSNHTCNKCREAGKDVHIHHIDGNPSNNKLSNLMVLCLNCHSEVSSLSLGKSYTIGELVKYKAEWETLVKLSLWNNIQKGHPQDSDSKEVFKKLVSNPEKYNTQDTATRREPKEGQVYHNLKQAHYIHTLADYLFKKGDYRKSIEVYDFVFETDPNNRLYALSNKGRCLYMMGRVKEALRTLRKAVELDPVGVNNLIFVSNALFKTQKTGDALKYCNRVLELDSNNLHALMLKGDLLATHNISKAIKLHERVSRARPRNVHLLHHLGVMYCKSGDHNKALNTFRKGLDIAPANHDLLLSEALETEHVRGKGSLRLYNKLLSKYPESPNALLAKGKILCERGEHANALQLFQKVNILRTDNDDVLHSIGLELDHLHKHKKSIEYYRKSLQINPMNVYALVNLSKQMSTRNPAEALKLVRRALRIEPQHKIALYNEMVIQSKLKNKRGLQRGKTVPIHSQ